MMKAYFKGVLLFNEQGDKRQVPLDEGVNIITGDSKSGKSALLDIIDYCLGSTRSTIPKGKITNFAYLYAAIFVVNSQALVIGRRAFDIDGRTHMYLRSENIGIKLDDVSLKYFNEKSLYRIEEVRQVIESSLGLNVTDTTEEVDIKKEGKASIRNMMSYLMQHQNLIASKFALFYRFDHFKKKEQVIKQFPVFAGWVDQEYYSYRITLDQLEKQKKQLEREEERDKKLLKETTFDLINAYKNYYNLIGVRFDQDGLSLEDLLKLRDNLPDFTRESYLSDGLEQRYAQLTAELEAKVRENQALEREITNLNRSENYGREYSERLKTLASKGAKSRPKLKKYACPLCGQDNTEINSDIINLQESLEWLEDEITKIPPYRKSFTEQITQLKNKQEEIQKLIRGLSSEVKKIEEMRENLRNNKKYTDQVIYAKARIDTEVKSLSQRRNFKSIDMTALNKQIVELKGKIKKYSIETLYQRAASDLSYNMNKIAKGLDFEKEFDPVDLVFDLQKFELYHKDKSGEIYLNEMGSGANWLSCHIALFLSLLRFFAVERKSVMPSLLFLDQPSQVYFPNILFFDEEKDSTSDIVEQEDIQAVKRIYSTILDEVEEIGRIVGYKPQIIITDHVDNLDLGKYNFEDYVRERWRDGVALI
ncbi:hypothetical protein CIG75_03865 [Tumebacillus algifaecis]|uniref:Rad50/SbcC-type AAA domain-containing protein n=1 Tax=Tumebacillus algifaecis TaxID=1214604 RepID=A0A223CYM1_9BACL|nr:DUF3732 domain-containing protein [Tumebacillus algifaecis]ASS74207.1 hypothetical protein CIG75_03865 [Tumebacillus algifaecis]